MLKTFFFHPDSTICRYWASATELRDSLVAAVKDPWHPTLVRTACLYLF